MKKVIIIAEAGVNHNGDIKLAKKLIDAASEAKVDYVKFQSFKAVKLVSPKAKKADYQIKNIGDNDASQYQMLKQLELSSEDHLELISYCNSKKINFFSTAFDVDGIAYLSSLNLNLFKIPSGELTNFPYLRAIANTKLPVILSTGMANLEEIEKSINVLISYGTKKSEITVLHCNTEYPTPMMDVNLKAMLTIKEKLGVCIGYSDHTLGIEVPIASVAMGAQVIEKHFTLDRNMKGPDHKASLEPCELKKMVEAIRNIEKAISGNGIKEATSSEKKKYFYYP
jgi:N-acetylneuraminate synthase/N,N'-diacetyllegionaminate synthase